VPSQSALVCAVSCSAVLCGVISLSIATAATEWQSTKCSLDRQTAINTCARVRRPPDHDVRRPSSYTLNTTIAQGRPADPIAPLSSLPSRWIVSSKRFALDVAYSCGEPRRPTCTVHSSRPISISVLLVYVGGRRRSHLRVALLCAAAATAQCRWDCAFVSCAVRKSRSIQSRACCSPKRSRNTARAVFDVDVSRLLRVVAALTATSHAHWLARSLCTDKAMFRRVRPGSILPSRLQIRFCAVKSITQPTCCLTACDCRSLLLGLVVTSRHVMSMSWPLLATGQWSLTVSHSVVSNDVACCR